jgi:hypothetical protein
VQLVSTSLVSNVAPQSALMHFWKARSDFTLDWICETAVAMGSL